MSATIADCVKLQMDYFYSNADMVVQALIASDDVGARRIMKECQRRGIDIAEALGRYFARMDTILGKPRNVQNGRFRVPIEIMGSGENL